MNYLTRNFLIKTNSTARLASIYKSSISLEQLYPNSSLKLTTPTKSPSTANKEFNGYIPVEQLDITYSKSSGPGGQNVNKVNTKVDVRFNVKSAKWLSDEIKTKLMEKLENKLTKEGDLIYRSDLTRFQHLNLADCLEKIRTSIRNCLVEKQQVVTTEKMRRLHEKSIRERLAIKRHRSQIKNDRRDLFT